MIMMMMANILYVAMFQILFWILYIKLTHTNSQVELSM